MARAADPIDLWNEWATEILVLLSLALQLVLLFLAGIRRRREASPVLRFILWLAYQLADSTAIYAVGHLSLSGTPREHNKLVAFWAPFLLLHLGGPDNITAYALQDNQLWLRHLTTLVVQVLGAAYVIYKHIGGGGGEMLILLAAILMFVFGLVKYAERTWALKCGNLDSIRTFIRKEARTRCHLYLEDDEPQSSGSAGWFNRRMAEAKEEEFLVRRAHSLFHICKCAVADSSADDVESISLDLNILEGLTIKQWIAVMEMELSLMYDILYTKAAVIHTELGYLVRAASPLVIATSFLLFLLSGKDGQSGVHVLISYILLGGAIFMEMTSLLSALGSSWTLAFLCNTRWSWLHHAALCSGRWQRFRGAMVCLHWLANVVRVGICRHLAIAGPRRGRLSRSLPGTMGQYNMLHLCTRPDTSRGPLLGRLAKRMGFAEWWERKHHSGEIAVPKMVLMLVSRRIFDIFKKRDLNTLGVIRNSWGARTPESLRWTLGVELQEGIIIWHISTDIFLAQSSRAKDNDEDVAQRVEAITAMSNYMMFLLVERPDMLPGLAQNRLYQQTCRNLEQIWSDAAAAGTTTDDDDDDDDDDSDLGKLFYLHDDPSNSRHKQRRTLAAVLFSQNITAGPEFPRLSYAIRVARELLKAEQGKAGGMKDPFQVLLDLWTDILVYAANRGSRESHAKRLNNGGELTTFLWLMTEHFHQLSVYLQQLSLDSKGKP